MTKVFIDGSTGTTGLRIADRMARRSDISLIRLSEERRKDDNARRDALNSADVAFLCLPDKASMEAVSFVENPDTVVIDTSTAFRTDPGWIYGFPELTGYREKIRNAKRIANPGCHASGFIALIAPLREAGLLPEDALLTCFSLTGYSGGGKKMIAQYEETGRDILLSSPRQYGLTQSHKHLPEMSAVCGLAADPVFCPIVADYYAGMEVTVPLFASQLRGTPDDIREVYRSYYRTGLVSYQETPDEGGFLAGNRLEGKDTMEVSVLGNADRILLVSRFDNLGKGASGAAIQNMNLSLGLPEAEGLEL